MARLLCCGLLGIRRLAGRSSQVTARRGKLRWALDLTEGIDLSIYLFGSFEGSIRRISERLIGPGAVVFDLGANIGAHTLPLAHHVAPHGRILAVEATDFAFEKLERNLGLNPGLETVVRPVQAHLVATGSAVDRPAPAYSSWPLLWGGPVHAVHRGRAMGSDRARIATVDELALEHGFPRVDLVKLDVDGAETEVLAGARQLLAESGPPIVLEMAPWLHEEDGRSLAALLEILRQESYRLFDPTTGRGLPTTPAEWREAVPLGSSVNILARRVPQGAARAGGR